MQKNNNDLETIKLLVLTSRKVSLYSKNHPVVKQSLTQLFENLKAVLLENAKVTVSLKGENLFLNEVSLSPRQVGAHELLTTFKNLQIESITFSRGLELTELENLIELLSSGKKADERITKLKNDFLAKGFTHIKANIIRYEKVEEGQKVVSSTLEEAEGFLSAKVESKEEAPVSPLAILSDFLSGKVDSSIFKEHEKDIIAKLIEEPTLVTEAIIQAALACGNLRQVFEKLRQCLIEPLADELYNKKRKPERIISLLERSINTKVDEEHINEQIQAQKKDIGELFAQFHDELKVLMLTKLFEATKPDNNKFIQRAGKLLSNVEELHRLFPQLKAKLLGGVLKEEASEEFLAQLESSLSAGQRVSVSKAEYERLKNKAKLFDKTLLERVSQATQELEKKNKRLADEKERVDTVIRNLADGLIVVDKEGKVVMINPAAESLLGMDKAQKIGQPLAEGLQSHQLLALTKGNLSDEGGLVSKQIQVKSADEKTERILRASTAVVENESGGTVGMVMVLSDITRQKQVEKMKSDFVAHMSHELRTPIIAAQKAVSLILSRMAGEVNTDQNKFLEIANSNLGRLSKLINNILDFSKIEGGKLKLSLANFNLVDLVKEATQSLLSWAQDKHIELVTELPEGPMEIEADRQWLGQVIINLISNALKFTPEQGKIIISAKVVAEDEESVEVDVTDNGIGIDEKDKERIFNKFEQVSLAVPAGVSGTGLGLAISREIVQLHRGKIWVDSQVGKGSTFSFVIPRKFSVATANDAKG